MKTTVNVDQALKATIRAFKCVSVVVIPVYADKDEAPDFNLKALYDDELYFMGEHVLIQAALEAKQNVDKRMAEMPTWAKTNSSEYCRLLELGMSRLAEFEEIQTLKS